MHSIMVLHIGGPRADRFVELLEEFSGWDLDRDAASGRLSFARNGLIGPFVSPTLQQLVGRMINDAVTISIRARADVRGGVVDSFFATPPGDVRQVGRRSVFVNDLITVRQLDPNLCAALIAHFLAEYFDAAQRGTPNQFADAHVAGLRAEADVIHDLTGRPVFHGATRPWDQTIAAAGGRLRSERHYGPGNIYYILLGNGPVRPIISVSRSNP